MHTSSDRKLRLKPTPPLALTLARHDTPCTKRTFKCTAKLLHGIQPSFVPNSVVSTPYCQSRLTDYLLPSLKVVPRQSSSTGVRGVLTAGGSSISEEMTEIFAPCARSTLVAGVLRGLQSILRHLNLA